MIVFIDTNVVLQCRPLEDVDWKELGLTPAKGTPLRVVVPLQVIHELDRHKQGGNSRRASRAKAFLSKLGDLIRGKVDALVLKHKRQEIVVTIAARSTPDWSALGLDPAHADDRIIAEVCSAASGSQPVHLVAADLGMVARSRGLGFEPHAVPDSWLLPPEPDETAKENARLKAELARRESASPQIKVLVADADGNPLETVGYKVRLMSSISDELPDAIATAAGNHYARSYVPFAQHGREGVLAPDKEFADGVREAVRSLPMAFAMGVNSAIALQLLIENDGGAVADGLRVGLSVSAGFTLTSVDRATMKPRAGFPFPRFDDGSIWRPSPDPRDRKWLLAIFNRDAIAVQGIAERSGPRGVEFAFHELRHHTGATRPFAVSIAPTDLEGPAVRTGVIDIWWSMKNRIERETMQIPLRATVFNVSMRDAVRELAIEAPFDGALIRMSAGDGDTEGEA